MLRKTSKSCEPDLLTPDITLRLLCKVKTRRRYEAMRKVLVVAVLVLTLSLGGFAFQNEPDGFRGVEVGGSARGRYEGQ